MIRWLTILSFCLAASAAADWPTNVVRVTDSATNAECLGLNNPHECCAAVHPNVGNTCDGFEGADIREGLETCQAAGGCILQLPCNATFANAENNISSASNSTTDDRHGIIYSTGFQNGLVIQGCGTSTILQSKIPPATMTAPTAAIFYLDQWDPAGAPVRGLPRVAFRNFQCDGQSQLQPSFMHTVTPWSQPDRHACIDTRGFFSEGEIYDYFEIQHVYAHHFTGQGFKIGSAVQGMATGNTVTNIGCWQDFDITICNGPADPFPCCSGAGAGTCNTVWANNTAVAGDVECGCGAGDPGDCREWNLATEFNAPSARSPGFKIGHGFGIRHNGPGRWTIANNTISDVSKYGVTCDVQDVATQSYSSDLCRVDSNTMNQASLFQGTHASTTWFTGNTTVQACINGQLSNVCAAIESNGMRRRAWIIGNTVSGNNGTGINLQSWSAFAGINRAVRIEGNTINNTGAWVELQNNASAMATIRHYTGALNDCVGELGFYPTSMEIVGNTLGSNNTAFATLFIGDHGIVCEGNRVDPLTISGANVIHPVTWGAHAATVARVLAQNINATGLTMNTSGAWTWLADSTGTCSGWTTNGTSSVVDSSGNAIGDCEP